MNKISKRGFPGFRRLSLPRSVVIIAVLISFSIPGCIGRGKPAPLIEHYTFEYPSPTFPNLSRLEQTIKVERFSVAKAFNTVSMVFRPEAFKLDTYASNRWMVNPGDMTSDYLLRDLRNSGLFRAAFSYRDYEDARFMLEGGLEEFLEIDEGKTRSAVMTLSVNLLDMSRTGTPGRLIFQKKYRSVEPITDADPAGLARAMSNGMAKVSSQVIKDVYDAVTALR
ncbi:MAG TPA: ABC-type transport auxiliary lipoprotein family protein [Geobacteraceae bacterium]|nr:ABC-type transport auxiliary lipoprotein family protein [Geobacteraceae bacterium]